MDLEKNKIPSPFKAPDGYFDSFQDRLNEKMTRKPEKQLKVSRGGLAPMEYAAVAATLAAILVTVWFLFLKPETEVKPEVVCTETPAIMPDTVAIAPEVSSEAETEDALVESLMEEPDSENPVAVSAESVVYEGKDQAIAMQLEDAGLIVMDAQDGLFDPFEL